METTSTKHVSSNGPKANREGKYAVFTGKFNVPIVGDAVSLGFSRTQWQGDEESIKRVKSSGQVNGEGYVNVAGELGLSGARDYSTYHQQWVRRQGLGYY